MHDRERALSALYSLDPGTNRETWLQILMAAKDADLSLDDITEWSRPAPNFGGDRDCRSVWQSIKRGPITAATLYRFAHLQGWKDPGRTPQNAHTQRLPAAKMVATRRETIRPAVPENVPRVSPLKLWQRCVPATPDHAYIVAKHGQSDDLRMVPLNDDLHVAGHTVAGWLAVPARTSDGVLKTLQLIPPPGKGTKLNLPGASFGDGFFSVGGLSESQRVYVVEGIGQAWACWRATGDAAVVTFGAGRFRTVATALRESHPDLPLVLVPDRGKESQTDDVARQINGACVKLPQDKPDNYDANDYAAEHGSDELANLLNSPAPPVARYRIKSAADILSAPPLRWLIRGVLPAEGLACIFGASGSGKSFLALDLCAAVASGQPWFSYKVNNAVPVVYCALEGEAGFGQRVKAWQDHHGVPLPERLRFVMQSCDLRNADDVRDLADAVVASGGAGGLLVIDTLNRAASGADENTSRDMGEILNATKTLQAQFGGLVLMVHHSGKDQSRGLRGHSSLNAALDASIEVVKHGNRHEWRIDKAKDGSDDAGQGFRLQIIETGRHEDGQPITSCVVVSDDGERELKRRTLAPKSGAQKVALDTLDEILRRDGTPAPPSLSMSAPDGCLAVTIEHAIEQIRGRLVCEPKRRTERAQQALTALHAKGLIGIESGLLWRT